MVGTVQGSGEYSNSSRRVDIDDLILRAGRPVLVAPISVDYFDVRCALVAWTESREARRALADALPLLRLMGRVVIARLVDSSSPGEAQCELDKVVAWLAGHGIIAVPRIASPDGDDGECLIALAEEEGAGLIAAGAYAHSRAREWILGGVTHTLLHQGARCVLLSH